MKDETATELSSEGTDEVCALADAAESDYADAVGIYFIRFAFLLPQISNENALPHPFVVGGYRASFSRRKGNVNGPIEVRHANDGRSLSPEKDLFQQSREHAI